ncbi:hypothetical protein BDM02DRAFT_3100629, partial [Thelephora ganbajun]
ATSAIDYETDAAIQNSLRTSLGSDVTLFVIAHRFRTTMDTDKIAVPDVGNIVEFERPSELLGVNDSQLKASVDESGDEDTPCKMTQHNFHHPSLPRFVSRSDSDSIEQTLTRCKAQYIHIY